jgi:NhaA family Na+:H+ antiporter
MVIFFFVVGLEIKRELVAGELRDPRKAMLPAVAALGGMVVPATIYLAIEASEPARTGWGVPVATDIAFVVGVMALLGSRVPPGLKILLLALAIVDDIGAVLIIAIVYTSTISFAGLALAAAGFGLVYLCNRIGVRHTAVYVALAVGIWLAFQKAGVHPTVAGVILGLMTPTTARVDRRSLRAAIDQLPHDSGGNSANAESRHEQRRQLSLAASETIPPLYRLEEALHPWVAFGIMPLFALANAGVRFQSAAVTSSVAMAVATGLVLGKPLGIVLFSLGAVKAGWARMPSGVTWKALIGGGCLGGIGFTMSLFIAGLALEDDQLEAGKVGTLLGSAVSAALGSILLWCFVRPAPTK